MQRRALKRVFRKETTPPPPPDSLMEVGKDWLMQLSFSFLKIQIKAVWEATHHQTSGPSKQQPLAPFMTGWAVLAQHWICAAPLLN